MSTSDRQMELQALLLNGELAADDAPEVLELFRARPDLLLELSSSVAIDRLLGIAAEPADEAQAFAREVVTRLELKPQREAFTRTVRKRLKPKPARWTRLALPLAAALALFAGLGWWVTRDDALARVRATADIGWTNGSGPAIGTALQKDATVSIDEGLLELSLPGRGYVVLEAPASLTVRGRKDFTLTRGRAVFQVTPGGHGLTVHTPHGTAVDLGTAFALSVTEDSSELHILEGSVAFQSIAGGESTLRAGEAIEGRAAGTKVIKADTERFVQRVPVPAQTAQPAYYWPCDESAGRQAATSNRAFAFKLHAASADGAAPRWTDGPSGAALSFDGEGAFAQSAYPGIEGSTPRTVALWVKIPRDWTPEDAGALVSWGRFEWNVPGVMFELTLNRDPKFGPLGAPQLDSFGDRVTAATDLRDGEWHHLAVTTYQESEKAARTHVLFYVDGHLVSSFPRSIPRIDTLPGGERHGVLLGRSIQSINIPHPPREAFFRGAIDGVFIGSDVLNTSGLESLLGGSPPRRR